MLPAPTCTVTIPSVQDDTILNGRVYHPVTISSSGATGQGRLPKKAAIIAHPYAPLGGCQNDPIVQAVAAELLKLGFVVGTFDFRGAGSSKGKTSWTGRPEVNDYVSFAGFLIHYLNYLQSPEWSRATEQSHKNLETVPSLVQSSDRAPADSRIDVEDGLLLILGGYSYGSLITTLLPSTEVILSRFSRAAKNSAAAEIMSRAAHLSGQWNIEARHDSEARRGRQLMMGHAVRAPSHSTAMGGKESQPGDGTTSGKSRRSLDGLRRSLDVSKRKATAKSYSRDDEVVELHQGEVIPSVDIQVPKTSYLLISPLLPPISTLATMFSKFGNKEGSEHSSPSHPGIAGSEASREKLLVHNTLAIYGDKDLFTSRRKLRDWAEHLACERNSKFRFREIPGAGHFWVGDGVEEQMRAAVREWVQDVVGEDDKGHSL